VKSETTPYGILVFGNLKNPHKMITAHIDEVGFQVIKKNEDGTFMISQSGHASPTMLCNSHVYVQTSKGKVGGFIYPKKELGDYQANTFNEIFLDVMEPEKVEIGNFGSYQRIYMENDEKIISTALDNKMSVEMILEMVEEKPELLKENMFAFVTEEETTYDCINGLSHLYKPEYAFVLDMIPVNQVAEAKMEVYPEMGKGASLLYSMHKYHMHPKLKAQIEALQVPHQKVFVSIDFPPEPQLTQKNGVTKGLNIMIPMNGWHSAGYTMYKKDYDNMKDLVYTLVEKIH
jgi:putative aminopeptidase FrvX